LNLPSSRSIGISKPTIAFKSEAPRPDGEARVQRRPVSRR
jgi:hypothetical protein